MNTELFPKTKTYSLVIIELYQDDDEPYKLLETDDPKQAIEEIRKTLTNDQYLMLYDKNGITVKI